jgi:exopolysaccharide biosynthesis protein
VYRSVSSLEGKPNLAYYVVADLEDKNLEFTTDTSHQRRLKPSQFFEKNGKPLVVVNTSFFSFATNQNLNIVMKDGRMLAYNIHSLPARGKDTFTYRHPLGSAIGIDKKRRADVAWIFTDSSVAEPFAIQQPLELFRDSINDLELSTLKKRAANTKVQHWKMETAVGGGPVLVQDGEVRISNNEENKFAGKAINDKHPRTAMGYTKEGKLIIMVVQGRNPGVAEGASLVQLAEMLKELGCQEALNLDGGGSSCLLVNGKETIRVSDSGVQRPVPGVFIIQSRN